MQTCWSWPPGGSWRSSAVSGASLIGRCSASCGGQQRSGSNPVAPSCHIANPSRNIAAGRPVPAISSSPGATAPVRLPAAADPTRSSPAQNPRLGAPRAAMPIGDRQTTDRRFGVRSPGGARHSASHCRSASPRGPTFDPAPLGLVCWRPMSRWSRFLSRQHPAAARAHHAGAGARYAAREYVAGRMPVLCYGHFRHCRPARRRG